MNQVLDIIAKRSSIRAYTDEKLSEEQIQTLVTAGLQAPTARNKQEIHISVLDGKNPILTEIEAEKRTQLAANAAPSAREAVLNPAHNFYYEAPIVLILSADSSFPWAKLDAGIAVENMALAAQSMGLGNLIIGIIKGAMLGEKKEYFAKKLDFPENYEFAIALAVGYPATEKKPHIYDYEKAVSYIK